MGTHQRYYLIDSIIIYEVNEHIIRNAESTISTKLLTTASACLTTLLNQKGEVVSRKDLMYAGWEKHGFIVSTNTLNQNILLIRKAIAKISEKEIIKTVFRQGISIPKGIHIIEFKDYAALETYLESYDDLKLVVSTNTDTQNELQPAAVEGELYPISAIEITQLSAEKPIEPRADTEIISPSQNTDGAPTLAATDTVPPIVKRQEKTGALTLVSVLMLVIVIMSVMLFRYHDRQQQYYLPFENYQPVAPLEGFAVHIDSNKCPKNYALNFLRQHLADFSKDNRKNLYFSCERNIHRASAFMCDKDIMSPDAICKSYYFL